MPSNKNPITVVLPGPGRLPASTVSASAFIFPGGGGGGGSMAALMAHITDPTDAHMAGAIGIPPVYPLTGEPLLSSNVPPGVIDGESVLDFIAQFKDLLPARPPYLGFSGTNSGVPDWGNIDAMLKGGYNDGVNTVFTRYIVDGTTYTDFTISGILYPADRGVLALYSTTDQDFTNPFSSATLVAALYLGTTAPAPPVPPPVGIPQAGFDETLRVGGQPNYVATNAGLDWISLTYRLPYATSYGPGVPYTPYATNFSSFQLGSYTISPLATPLAGGGNQNWFLVHWRSTFATSLAAIDPGSTALTLADLSLANCYSAVPTAAADFDDPTQEVFVLNRHRVFSDTNYNVLTPSVAGLSTSLSATFHLTSGVPFYDDSTGVSFSYSLDGQDQFANSFQTGNSAPVPVGFESATFPMTLDMSEFGDTTVYNYQFNDLTDGVLAYSVANPPTTGGIGQRIDPAFALTTNPYTISTPATPYSLFKGVVRSLVQSANFSDPNMQYLYNSWDQTGNAGVQGGYNMEVTEKFVDESYRYDNTYVPTAADPIQPVGAGVAYDNTLVLSGADNNLQVIASHIVYPKIDFSVNYDPAGPNYSGIPGGDLANYLRRYTRVVNTGIARNTGKIRIRGLAASAFQTNAAYDGTETTGHITGGAIIQVKVPGVTGWLDLGRSLGDPGLATTDFYGCSTAVTVSGPDVIVSFQTTAFTADNGSGDFPLYVRVSFLNNVAGLALALDEIEWQAP